MLSLSRTRSEGPARLLQHCQDAVSRAQRLGAEQVEVVASAQREEEVSLRLGGLQSARSSERTVYGVRAFRRGAQGFATVDREERLEAACRDAVAMAESGEPDPLAGLAGAESVEPLGREPDPELSKLDLAQLLDRATAVLSRLRASDPRVQVESGALGVWRTQRALASSEGLALSESASAARAELRGLAVDGAALGALDRSAIAALTLDAFDARLDSLCERFVGRCVDSLGARPLESFAGSLVLAPDVVRTLVLENLLSALSGKALGARISPLVDRRGETIADPRFTLTDDPRLPGGVRSAAFDREGVPTRRTPLIEGGVLCGALYDVTEARRVGGTSTGHARGGADERPRVAPSNLLIEPGDVALEGLCEAAQPALWVPRFSGTASLASGDFSGFAAGCALLHRGERVPVRAVQLQGNLYALLRSIRALSSEIEDLEGAVFAPALHVEGVTVTV